MRKSLSLLLLWILAACQPAATAVPPVASPAADSMTATITPAPSPTVTVTPTATPTIEQAIFPYTIAGLRAHEYQSGVIRIRKTLDETDNYTAYLIEYPSDGLTITGVMQIPRGEGPFPVIVMNHGFFARSVYATGDGTDRASIFLAEHGYLTLASDYRSWAASDVGESLFYSGLAIDVINLLKAIPSIPQADPGRVGVWGHSMGGGVTMKVLTVIGPQNLVAPITVKAAVLYSTVSADMSDVIARWGNGCFGDIAAGEQIIGCNSADVVPLDLPEQLLRAYTFTAGNAEAMQTVSPIFHLEAVQVPIQIHYGEKDGRTSAGTPPEWSVKLTQALRDAGKTAEMLAYPDQGHSFIGEPWFQFMIRVLRFFDANLK